MPFKAFISFKNLDAGGKPTRDSVIAAEVYRRLRERGVEVFFSNEEVQRKNRPDYGDLIDEALESSSVLILVGTCEANIESKWVKYEWNSFKNEINSGRKEGYIIPIIEQMTLNALPFALRQGQVYTTAELDKAINMIAGVLEASGGGAGVDAAFLNKRGEDYYIGRNGMPQDLAYAVRDFTTAAELGNAMAQFNLAVCYEKGNGVNKDIAKAIAWYTRAAEQDHAAAQFNLGVCYRNGVGVEQSYANAARWYARAVEQGHPAAMCNLGWCYEFGKGVNKNYSEAAKMYLRAAEQGHVTAQCNIGGCYYFGKGVQQNYAEAAKWYRRAAEKGNSEAQYNLGICYLNGHGVEVDIVRARMWLEMASTQGNKEAVKTLAGLR